MPQDLYDGVDPIRACGYVQDRLLLGEYVLTNGYGDVLGACGKQGRRPSMDELRMCYLATAWRSLREERYLPQLRNLRTGSPPDLVWDLSMDHARFAAREAGLFAPVEGAFVNAVVCWMAPQDPGFDVARMMLRMTFKALQPTLREEAAAIEAVLKTMRT